MNVFHGKFMSHFSFATAVFRTHLQALLLCAVMLAGPASATAAPSGDVAKQAIPSSQEIEAAQKTLKSIYGTAVADAKNSGQRTPLARTVLDDSMAATTGAERYAMLGLALNLAAEGDDAMLLLDVCERMSSDFEVDRVSLVAEQLSKSNADPASDRRAEWMETVRKTFDQAMQVEQFEHADQLLTSLSGRARKGGDPKSQTAITALRKRLTLKRKQVTERDQLRKAAAAADASPEDHTKLGKYECLVRNDWAAGLQALAQGDDVALAAASRMELNRARGPHSDAPGFIATADVWAQCQAKVSTPERTAIINHAIDLYLLALPDLKGLDKVRVQRSIEMLQKEAGKKGQGKGGWMTVFRSDDPVVWNTDTTEKPNRYAVSLDTLPDGVRYVRLRRANGQAVVFAMTNAQLAGLARGERFGWQGGKPELYKATMLGAFDASRNLVNQPNVFVFGHGSEYYSGYGFGSRFQTVGPAVAVWDSKPIPGEVLEISVTCNHLMPDEQELLLR